MKIKSFLQLIILFLSIFYASGALATENITSNEAKSWANDKGYEILNILANKNLAEKYQKLDKILYEDIDLDHIAKFVVGKYWRQMTDEQKAVYVPLFKRYTSALYKSYPLDLPKGAITYEVDKVIADKKLMNVFCTIKITGLENSSKIAQESKGGFKVLFVLIKNNGKIQVHDLKIEESSLLLAYKDRFIKMIHIDSDDDIEWFLEDLETIVNDNEAKNMQNLEIE